MADGNDARTKLYAELAKVGIDVPELEKEGHASRCLLMCSLMEAYFEDAIRGKLPRLRKKRSKKMFGTYGPMSTLDAKIEFAFLLEILSADQKRDADIVRGIRNKFAHSTDRMSFENADVVQACKRLSTYEKSGKYAEGAYVLATAAIIDHVKTFRKEPSIFDPPEE